MANHPKRARDPAQLAKLIADIATGNVDDRQPLSGGRSKNAAAEELGRSGGLKGGAARAAKLTSDQRREISRKAAEYRWAAKKPE